MEANLFEHFFPSNNPSILTFMLATFFLSGIVKGFLGIGLAAAAMALLTLILEPTYAIALWYSLSYLPTFHSSFDQIIEWSLFKTIGPWASLY